MPQKSQSNKLNVMAHSCIPVLTDEFAGRLAFLDALQLQSPEVWRGLQKLVNEKSDKQTIVRWMIRAGITDPWFVDVVWDTLECWLKHPDWPQARLDPGHRWWDWKVGFHIPWFSPVFEHPTRKDLWLPPESSKLADEDRSHESTKQMMNRLRSEFEIQLREYGKYIESIFGEDRTELRKHAGWTAMAFTGLSFTKIASNDPGLRMSLQGDTTVKTAIHRLCGRISLTLPGVKRKKPSKSG